MLKRIRHGTLVLTTPDGEAHVFEGSQPGTRADMQMHDWKIAGELMRTGDIAMAEGYRDGRLASSDWTALLLFFVENAQALEDVFYGNKLAVLYYRLQHWLRSNSKRQARKNIAAHYDLSNDFYGLAGSADGKSEVSVRTIAYLHNQHADLRGESLRLNGFRDILGQRSAVPAALLPRNSLGCGSSPAQFDSNKIDHFTLVSRGFGAGSGSGISPSS